MTDSRLDILKSKLSNFKTEFDNVNGTPGFYIDRNDVIDACKILKEDPELKFTSLLDAISVDRFQKKNRYEMFYNLVSIENNERIFIKIKLDSVNPEMQSLTQIWRSANWYEREAYDMMGINFINHPDLRRMYMPEEFEYYPLRKDFPLMGIPDSIPLPNK
ncbi:MAG TPA: NADH-quinone oxidoreductase subunit C [Ignavibacteria bacterium]|nr:NADH-quinone oxidoreductase subunit C [Ignavibacteria bacterium]